MIKLLLAIFIITSCSNTIKVRPSKKSTEQNYSKNTFIAKKTILDCLCKKQPNKVMNNVNARYSIEINHNLDPVNNGFKICEYEVVLSEPECK